MRFVLIIYKETYIYIALSQTSMPTPWNNISCTDEVYANQSLSANTRWDNADAGLAWSAAVVNWQEQQLQGSIFHFSQSVADFFGSPTNVECGDISIVGTCNQYSACVSPAAYDAILTSFTYLHDVSVPISVIDYNTNLLITINKVLCKFHQ